MNSLTYSYEIRSLIREIKQGLETSGYQIDDRYIKSNNICPCCKKELKMYRNEVTKVGNVGTFIEKDTNIAILYLLCNGCSKQLERKQHFARNEYTDIEEFILDRIKGI